MSYISKIINFMNSHRTSAQLKQIARGIMIGKYRNALALLLASDLIINTLSVITATSNASYVGIIIGLLISIILVLFGTILFVGQCSFYLNIACNQKYQFGDLFNGLKVHPNKTILTQSWILLCTILPMIPAIVLLFLAFYAEEMTLIFFLGCGLFILGGAISWWISLRYSQVYFLLLDFPDSSTKELLNMSWKLMKGNVCRLLYIQVSFLPLLFAGLISFGIGFLFIKPYQYMTYTLFYLDLIKE